MKAYNSQKFVEHRTQELALTSQSRRVALSNSVVVILRRGLHTLPSNCGPYLSKNKSHFTSHVSQSQARVQTGPRIIDKRASLVLFVCLSVPTQTAQRAALCVRTPDAKSGCYLAACDAMKWVHRTATVVQQA